MKHVYLSYTKQDELIEHGWNPDEIVDNLMDAFPNNDVAEIECVNLYYVHFKVDGVNYLIDRDYNIEEDTFINGGIL